MIKGIIGYHQINEKKRNIIAVKYDTEKIEKFRTENTWGIRVPIENENLSDLFLYLEFNEIGTNEKKKNLIF